MDSQVYRIIWTLISSHIPLSHPLGVSLMDIVKTYIPHVIGGAIGGTLIAWVIIGLYYVGGFIEGILL
tara:strand:- start:2724 stop:2927 length:204 start_codon:yes stop_codon:yes gene_type:complete